MPTISVIVPVYKVEPWLRRCVDSILAQSFSDFELILVDDGSPDNCGAMCDEYAGQDSRVRVIHQQNQGQGAARNHALDRIFKDGASQYVSFIDADDWVHPRYLELLLGGVRKGYQICVCDSIQVQAYDPQPQDFGDPEYAAVSASSHYASNGARLHAYVWGALFDAELWRSLRFPLGRKWEDLACSYLCYLPVRDLIRVSAPLYYYFFNPEGTVNSPWSPRRLDFIWALERLLDDAWIKTDPIVYPVAKKTYLHALAAEYNKAEKVSPQQEPDIRGFRKQYQKKLQKAIRRYGLKAVPRENRAWVYEVAHPKRMWLYWSVRAFLRRFRPRKKQDKGE